MATAEFHEAARNSRYSADQLAEQHRAFVSATDRGAVSLAELTAAINAINAINPGPTPFTLAVQALRKRGKSAFAIRRAIAKMRRKVLR